MASKTVLVTGASAGGLGAALCTELHRQGLQVFAGLRDPSKAGHLSDLSGLNIIKLDVTSPSSLQQALQEVEQKTAGKLDILVNNAGISFVTPTLDASLESAKQVYDVNVWGVLATTQCFTPLLLASKGTVVNISSVGGYLNLPWFGIYTSSKAALTSLSQTLRLELEPFGVKVITAVVGGVETNIYANLGGVRLPEGSIYKPALPRIEEFASGKNQPGQHSPDRVASELVKDILGNRNGLVWRGGFAGTMRMLTSLPSVVLGSLMPTKQAFELLK